MTTPTSTAPGTPATPAATHPCARCGAPVALDVGLCERCNPLGLKDSASSQVHGTVFVAVALAVVGLALIARLAVSGIGPFTAEVVSVVPSGDGLVVTLAVLNQGTSEGTTTCRVTDPVRRTGPAALELSPRIGPGATVTFDIETAKLGREAVPLDVTCSAP